MPWCTDGCRKWLPLFFLIFLVFHSGPVAAEEIKPSNPRIRTHLDWVGYASIELGRHTGPSTPADADFTLSNGFYANFDVAAYVSGLWDGKYELTAAYDHAKSRSHDPLERSPGIYPIMGDSSMREHDAPSRDAFYIRIQKDETRFMYGDFQTGLDLELAPFQRRLTGPRFDTVIPLGEEGDRELGLTMMAARTKQLPFSELLPAQGTAGFYRLTHGRIVPRSERVELVTYDPRDPDEPIEMRPLRRDLDYTIDYVEGTLLFRQPIPIQDVEGNQNYLRVEYEYDPVGSGPMRGTGAARVTYRSAEFELGATHAYETGGNMNWSLTGTDARVRLLPGLSLRAEAAQSHLKNGTVDRTGNAYLLELQGRAFDRVGVRLFHRDADAAFETRANESTLTGTRRTGIEVEFEHSDALKTQIGWETQRKEELITLEQQQRNVTSLGAVYRLAPWTISGRLESGTITHSGTVPDRLETRGGSLSLDRRLDSGNHVGLTRESRWSRSVDSGETAHFGATGLRYQGAISETSAWSLGYTLTDAGEHGAWVGLDQRIFDSEPLTSTLYSRYRLHGTSDTLHGQASVGLANQWQITPELSADIHYEVVADPGDPVPQAGDELPRPPAQNALSLALGYVPDAPYDVFVRHSRRRTQDQLERYSEIASVGRLGTDYSLLAKAIWTEATSDDSRHLRETQSLGLAYRPLYNDRLNALLFYEQSTRQGETTRDRTKEQTLSAEGSYWMTSTVEMGLKFAQRHRLERTPPAAPVRSVTDLYQIRTTVQLISRLDFNAIYRRLFQKTTDLWQVGYQASLGYRLIEDDPRWLAELGYRYADYAPEDDPSDDAFIEGPFVRLTYLF